LTIDFDRPQINPLYTQGEIVRLTTTAGQAEAELIHNMLLGEGIPSEVRSSTIASALRAAQMPMLSYSVFVRESALEQARFVLGLDDGDER
jgi:hypothetical protein